MKASECLPVRVTAGQLAVWDTIIPPDLGPTWAVVFGRYAAFNGDPLRMRLDLIGLRDYGRRIIEVDRARHVTLWLPR